MPALATSTNPNNASWIGPTIRITTRSEPSSALNRVTTLARTICPTVRVGTAGTSLTWPSATRSATSCSVRPSAAGTLVLPVGRGVSLDRPPLVEQAIALVFVDRPALQTQLHQVVERAADRGPRRDTEVLHHLHAVQRRAHRVEVLLLRQARDPLFQVVLERLELLRLEPVLRRAVGAGELIQLVEQRPGVTHVPADRAVAPLGVAVESQVHLDETGDVVHHVCRVPQRLEAFARHARPDDLVMVEGDALWRDRAGPRLADIVQQRREPERRIAGRLGLLDDRERVMQHVLVLVHGILLERKSTRLNSSHQIISYAVFCLKKK